MAAISPSQLQYMEEHINDSLVPNVLATIITCAIISFIAVALRFYSRSLTRVGLGIDDWMLLAAYLSFLAFNIGFGLATRWGLGRHIIAVTNAKSLAQSNISDEVWYGVAIAFTKFAVLLLYLRVFPQPMFRTAVYFTFAIVFSWMLVDIFGSIFQCVPIDSQWDPSKAAEKKCIDYGSFVLAVGIINIITDIIILCLPIPIIWGLRMKRQKKLLTLGIFAVGSCACIVSIARLTVAEKVGSPTDASWDDVPGGILSCVEIAVAIVAGSAPTYRPLIRKLLGQDIDHSSDGSRSYKNMNSTKRRAVSGITQTTEIQLSTHINRHEGDSDVGADSNRVSVVGAAGKNLGRQSEVPSQASDEERLYKRQA